MHHSQPLVAFYQVVNAQVTTSPVNSRLVIVAHGTYVCRLSCTMLLNFTFTIRAQSLDSICCT